MPVYLKRLLVPFGLALALSGLPLAASATAFDVSPWAYACGKTVYDNTVQQHAGLDNANCTEADGTGAVTATWSSGRLTLSKSGATTVNASSGATIFGLISLTSVSFDVAGYCGAGAPRLSVVTTDGQLHAFGCAANALQPGPDANGHVVLNLDASGDGYGNGGVLGKTITSIDFVQDEVPIGEGPQTAVVFLTNIQFVGTPTPVATPVPTAQPTATPVATASPTASPTHAPTAAPTATQVSHLAVTGSGSGAPLPGLVLVLGLGLLLVLAGGVVVARTQFRRF
jgi:cell division septation protein DedD